MLAQTSPQSLVVLLSFQIPGNLLATFFNLNDLDEHNFPIEHDASLSRADYNLNDGNSYSFNQSIFDIVLAYYDGMENTNILVAAEAKQLNPQCLNETSVDDMIQVNRVTMEKA